MSNSLMVSKESADLIISIISNDTDSLIQLSSQFKETCPKSEQFPALTSLATLLMDDILEPVQQYVVSYLLYDVGKSMPVQSNPFYSVMQYIIQSCTSNSSSYEQKLGDIVSCFLSSDSKIDEIISRSVHDIMDPSFNIEAPDLLSTSDSQVTRISPILVSERDKSCEVQISSHEQLLKEFLTDSNLWSDFEVPFFRPTLGIMKPTSEEMQVMNLASFEPPPFLFDDRSFINEKEAAKIYLSQAAKRTLTKNEIDVIIAQISNLQHEIASLKGQAMNVLYQNPRVGIILLSSAQQKTINQVLSNMENSDITLQNLEVVKQVVLHLNPSAEFFLKYIQNVYKKIKNTKTDQHSLAKMFTSMIVELQEEFSKQTDSIFQNSTILIELQSIGIELVKKGINEAQPLKDIC